MQDDFQKFAAIMAICVTIGMVFSTLASCEKERFKQNTDRDRWMVTCVEKGGKIAKEVYTTNDRQWAYDTCIEKK